MLRACCPNREELALPEGIALQGHGPSFNPESPVIVITPAFNLRRCGPPAGEIELWISSGGAHPRTSDVRQTSTSSAAMVGFPPQRCDHWSGRAPADGAGALQIRDARPERRWGTCGRSSRRLGGPPRVGSSTIAVRLARISVRTERGPVFAPGELFFHEFFRLGC